jgi:hypothetical protein
VFSRRQYEYRNASDYRGSHPAVGWRRLVRQRTLVLTQPALSANTFVTRQGHAKVLAFSLANPQIIEFLSHVLRHIDLALSEEPRSFLKG